MAAYGRVTLNRGGRNSRFDCILLGVFLTKCKDFSTFMNINAETSNCKGYFYSSI